MVQNFTRLFFHPVFSTKSREPYLTPALRARLFPYIGGLLTNWQGQLLVGGGVEDHVHLLVCLRPTHELSSIVQQIKGASSHWINEEGLLDVYFGWQPGYSAFTVSPSGIPAVRR